VPLPRLVLPTAKPTFFTGAELPSRKASSQMSKPFASRVPAMYARRGAKHLRPPAASVAASRSTETGIRWAKTAKPPRPQYPQDALETGTVRAPVTPPPVTPSSGLGKQWCDKLPLCVIQSIQSRRPSHISGSKSLHHTSLPVAVKNGYSNHRQLGRRGSDLTH